MISQKSNLIFVFSGLAVIIVLMIIVYPSQRDAGLKKHLVFNAADIDDRLLYVHGDNQGIHLKMARDTAHYTFLPYACEDNDHHVFANWAKRGDRIVKKPFNDTLKLIKDGKEYCYTFYKVSQQ